MKLRPFLLALFALVVSVLPALAAEGKFEIPDPGPNKADEPIAKELSPSKAGEFLDRVAGNWTRNRNCGTCHTNYPYLIARPLLLKKEERTQLDKSAPVLAEIRKFFEEQVESWDANKSKPRWDTEVAATAISLALNDANTTGKLHPKTRSALDRMWTLQKPNGAWNWLKCNWPPFEHDDYYGAVFVAVGVGLAPDGYAETEKAKAGMEKLRKYLKDTPSPDLHHKAWLLWASLKVDGLMTAEERAKTIQELCALQHEDGGWSLHALGAWKRRDGSANDKAAPSDGYGTGLVVYVLRQAEIPAADAHVKKGADWLRTHQRVSGRWFTRSLNNDKAHYITNAGSSFAVMALSACEEKK
jgi:squalene-hopene/tetraprenyl-beta-curcumene cyclase